MIGDSVGPNALTYRSQITFATAGHIQWLNPFAGGAAAVRDYLIAFDMVFPRVNLLGGSIDYYSQAIDTVFRVEVAHTEGERLPTP